ncbi:MAG: NUDIX domain-containing protein [bacterium]|nr:NUDIX domain-containing protein [bacterium]
MSSPEAIKKLPVQIVDDNDEIIEHKDRSEIVLSDIYRVSALWLTNSKGEILIAQRKLTKAHDPGKWGPAAAGTLEEGDTYESNAKKEAEEEIGLTGVEFQLGPKVARRIPESKWNYFGQWYTAVADKDIHEFVLQDDEVEAVRWISPEDLVKEWEQAPEKFVPSLGTAIDAFILNK